MSSCLSPSREHSDRKQVNVWSMTIRVQGVGWSFWKFEWWVKYCQVLAPIAIVDVWGPWGDLWTCMIIQTQLACLQPAFFRAKDAGWDFFQYFVRARQANSPWNLLLSVVRAGIFLKGHTLAKLRPTFYTIQYFIAKIMFSAKRALSSLVTPKSCLFCLLIAVWCSPYLKSGKN